MDRSINYYFVAARRADDDRYIHEVSAARKFEYSRTPLRRDGRAPNGEGDRHRHCDSLELHIERRLKKQSNGRCVRYYQQDNPPGVTSVMNHRYLGELVLK